MTSCLGSFFLGLPRTMLTGSRTLTLSISNTFNSHQTLTKNGRLNYHQKWTQNPAKLLPKNEISAPLNYSKRGPFHAHQYSPARQTHALSINTGRCLRKRQFKSIQLHIVSIVTILTEWSSFKHFPVPVLYPTP